ncbi:charged multivesicular body protein 7 isoform X1 [Bombus bifarius]|uniref:Charged multivesicular body protein 7 isoform X1 n=1 Tax=Bombus bifarius TaxID=103933 RepID=A0A6P8MXK5_9HYME|nr:charged multivesicular body protein 7 isoform X1 [Bombus bifarius]
MTTKIEDVDNNLPLPSEKMPKCWNEEERISALFSPFRTKSANPQDWVSKYKFWQNLIYEWLKYTKRNSFSIADLNGAFRRKGCTPLCLVTVVEELHRNNEIIPETEFLKEPCESWTAWSIDTFVKKPLVWSFSKVRSYVVNNEINKETRYIHLKIIKEFGDVILSILERKKESILIPFSELVKSCKSDIDKNISDNTIMLILIWLMREKKVVFGNNENQSELLIKIAAHSSDSITEIEEGLYKLMKQENILIKEIELMEEEKINIISEAKSYLTKGLRQVAKTYLRKKKELESTIEKRAQTLNNIQSLITSIQNTHTNTTVISAYKIGSDVLKKLNESCLSESNVIDIVDDLSEALEEQKEVQCILSESLENDDSNVDLEKELADLMKLDENILPSVPNTKLSSTIDELQTNLKNLHVEDATVFHVSSKLPKRVNNEKISKQYECV